MPAGYSAIGYLARWGAWGELSGQSSGGGRGGACRRA